jgi:PAS domain S-box-containing protein
MPPHAEADPAASPESEHEVRVLLVEDSELDAALVLRELRRGGFKLSSAVVDRPDTFLNDVRAHPPDIVLADYNLPQWSGMDALELLRQENLDIPLILVSGALGEETAVECIKRGVTDYVLKDRLTRLPVAVRRALEEKQTRLRQKYSEELFRHAIDASPTGILMVDGVGKILLANPEAEKLFGHTHEELMGRTVEMLVPERFRQRHIEQRASYDQAPRVRAMGERRELFALRKDGSEFPVGISLNAVSTPHGHQTLVTILDISARKKAERAAAEFTAELSRSNQELQDFAYIASHDLQEPLRMVTSYTELLGERYKGKLDENADKYIAYAVDGARRMQLLIRALLDYARVNSQARPLQPTDSAAVLKTTLTLLHRAIESNNAVIVCGNLPAVMADETQLGQVFQNLIGNALKFHGEKAPRIEIRAEMAADMWRFSVADNGIGMKKENSERIFQMFQRLHTREEYEGTGIGLSLSKRIVERHGGRIWFDSEPGVGTTFHFTMPKVAREATTASEAKESSEAKGAGA